MAISCDKNQVLHVPDDFDCGCQTSSYCVPVEQTDETPFKVSLTPLSGNLISNGNFASSDGWVLVGGAAISGGKATTDGSPNQIGRYCDYELATGYYRLTFTITEDVTDVLDGIVEVGGVNTVSFSGKPFAQTINWFFFLNNPTTDFLNIITTSGTMSIDDMSLTRISSAAFDIKDCASDTVYYSETDNSSVEYLDHSLISQAFTVAGVGQYDYELTVGYAIITLDWASYNLANGCYCLCLKDYGLIGYERIKNGNFHYDDFWTIANSGTEGWDITGGKAVHTIGGGAGDDIMSQTITALDSSLCYIFELTIDSVSGTGGCNLSVLYDSATETDVEIMSLTNYDVFPATFQIPFADSAATTIKIVSTAAGLRNISIDGVSIRLDSDCLECSETTECISLNSWDNFCTSRGMCNILVTGVNANSAFGFPEGYEFKGRIFGNIRNASGKEIQMEAYKDFSGLKTLQYIDREKIKELQVFQVPQYVHDWLELALSSQTLTLTINGVSKEFIKVVGDYTPNWRKRSPDAPVIVEIQETQQLPFNARNT